MVDRILRGGTVVDGTGAPGTRADVALADGRIVGVGPIGAVPGAEELDATGCVVAPGFVDVHTHYDAQLLWDPTASPSLLHGVTSVIGGNCGFSVAPLRAGDAGYVMRMMARVEGMDLATLESGPPWGWVGFGEWLDTIDRGLSVNAGFLAGHSTIRRAVMGEAAHEPADADQVAAMVTLLDESLAAGALGFSSSLGEAHFDGENHPVPSRSAGPEEFLALAAALRPHPGTSLEFIAAMGEIPDARIQLMTEMSLAAGRPLNWNLLGSLSPDEVYEQQLTSCDHATRHGARVVALALPDLLTMRLPVLAGQAAWARVLALPAGERRRAAADPEIRHELVAAMASPPPGVHGWDLLEVAEGDDAGRTVAELAARDGVPPAEALVDAVVPDALPVAVRFPSLTPALGASPESWDRRGEVWRDDRVVLGGSDAGAHCDLMCHANYPTVVLGEMTRDRGLFTLEDAVRRMTEVPARLYGLTDRGRVAEGWWADLVVFDPDEVGSGPVVARRDFPADGLHLTAAATGVRTVLVAGEPVVVDGGCTDARPGRVLRSGRDTETVPVPGAV